MWSGPFNEFIHYFERTWCVYRLVPLGFLARLLLGLQSKHARTSQGKKPRGSTRGSQKQELGTALCSWSEPLQSQTNAVFFLKLKPMQCNICSRCSVPRARDRMAELLKPEAHKRRAGSVLLRDPVQPSTAHESRLTRVTTGRQGGKTTAHPTRGRE
jgi:hypothetical protein